MKNLKIHVTIFLVSLAVMIALLAFQTVPTQTGISKDGITLLAPSLPVPGGLQEQVLPLLAKDSAVRGVFVYAVTNVEERNGYQRISVAGFPMDQQEPYSLDQAVWMGLVTLAPGAAGGVVEELMPAAPAGEQPGRGGAGDILPFRSGSQAQYGVLGVHACGFGLTGWSAVDLFPADQNVYASTAGEVSYVCRDGTQMSIRIGDHMYVHLVDNGLQTGQQIGQGQLLSSLVTGSFTATCGNASQSEGNGHVHFCFIPDGAVYTSDGYTLNIQSGDWVKGEETVSPLGYLTADWQDASIIPVPQSMVGGNLWDEMTEGFVSLFQRYLAMFPFHQDFGLSEQVMRIAASTLKIVYATILINFRMRVVIWVFGIISVLEAVRLTYAAWMWVKRAIPVVG